MKKNFQQLLYAMYCRSQRKIINEMIEENFDHAVNFKLVVSEMTDYRDVDTDHTRKETYTD